MSKIEKKNNFLNHNIQKLNSNIKGFKNQNCEKSYQPFKGDKKATR